jgi:hypothetical protein
LHADLLPVWNGFIELSNRRQVGFSPCPLSLSDIRVYLDEYGIDGTDRRRRFIKLISALDNHWLKRVGEDRKCQQKSKKSH